MYTMTAPTFTTSVVSTDIHTTNNFECPLCHQRVNRRTLTPRVSHLANCAILNGVELKVACELAQLTPIEWQTYLQKQEKEMKSSSTTSSSASPTSTAAATPTPTSTTIKPKARTKKSTAAPKPLTLDSALGSTRAGSGVGTALSHMKQATGGKRSGSTKSVPATSSPSAIHSSSSSSLSESRWELSNGVFLLGQHFIVPNPPPMQPTIAQFEKSEEITALAKTASSTEITSGASSTSSSASVCESISAQIYSWRHYVHEMDQFILQLQTRRQWAMVKYRLLQEKLESEGGTVTDDMKIDLSADITTEAMEVDASSNAAASAPSSTPASTPTSSSLWNICSSTSSTLPSVPFLSQLPLQNRRDSLTAPTTSAVPATRNLPVTSAAAHIPSLPPINNANLRTPPSLPPVPPLPVNIWSKAPAAVPVSLNAPVASASTATPISTKLEPTVPNSSSTSLAALPLSSSFAKAVLQGVSTPSIPPAKSEASISSSNTVPMETDSTPFALTQTMPPLESIYDTFSRQPQFSQSSTTSHHSTPPAAAQSSPVNPSPSLPQQQLQSESSWKPIPPLPPTNPPPTAPSSDVSICMPVQLTYTSFPLPSPPPITIVAKPPPKHSPLPLPFPLSPDFLLTPEPPSTQVNTKPEPIVVVDQPLIGENFLCLSPIKRQANSPHSGNGDHLDLKAMDTSEVIEIPETPTTSRDPTATNSSFLQTPQLDHDELLSVSKSLFLNDNNDHHDEKKESIVTEPSACLTSLPSPIHPPPPPHPIITVTNLLADDNVGGGDAMLDDDDCIEQSFPRLENELDISQPGLEQQTNTVNNDEPKQSTPKDASIVTPLSTTTTSPVPSTAAATAPMEEQNEGELDLLAEFQNATEERNHTPPPPPAATSSLTKLERTTSIAMAPASSIPSTSGLISAREIIELCDEDEGEQKQPTISSAKLAQTFQHVTTRSRGTPATTSSSQLAHDLSDSDDSIEDVTDLKVSPSLNQMKRNSFSPILSQNRTHTPTSESRSIFATGAAVSVVGVSANSPSSSSVPMQWQPASSRRLWTEKPPLPSNSSSSTTLAAATSAVATIPNVSVTTPILPTSTPTTTDKSIDEPQPKRAKKVKEAISAASIPMTPVAVAPSCPFVIGKPFEMLSTFGACCMPSFDTYSLESLKELMSAFGLKSASKNKMCEKLQAIWIQMAKKRMAAAVGSPIPQPAPKPVTMPTNAAPTAATSAAIPKLHSRPSSPTVNTSSPSTPILAPVLSRPPPLVDITQKVNQQTDSIMNVGAAAAAAAGSIPVTVNKKRKPSPTAITTAIATSSSIATPSASSMIGPGVSITSPPLPLSVPAAATSFAVPDTVVHSDHVTPELTAKIRHFLRSQTDLYLRILLFQPLEVPELSFLLSHVGGISLCPIVLRNWLDEEGIHILSGLQSDGIKRQFIPPDDQSTTATSASSSSAASPVGHRVRKGGAYRPRRKKK